MNYIIICFIYVVILTTVILVQDKEDKLIEKSKGLLKKYEPLVHSSITMEDIIQVWSSLDSEILKNKSFSNPGIYYYKIHSSYISEFKDLRLILNSRFTLLNSN